jgi:hypothetical protein
VAYDNTGVNANAAGGTSGNNNVNAFHSFNLALTFTVNSPISVTAMGAYSSGNLGGLPPVAPGMFDSPVPVAIYNINNLSSPQQVAGTFFQFAANQPYTVQGHSAMASITPVTLMPGTYAIVAANYGLGTSFPFHLNNNYWVADVTANQVPAPTFTTSTALTSLGWYRAFGSTLSTGVFTAPLDQGSSANPFFAAGTFDFTPVPEVAGFGLAAAVLLGLVYLGRCYCQRTRLA